ncbi:hypothetical protein ACIQ7Q_23525 [Streptomyces sp. NPDC096176]|uniref:hypothetical protein n=1 Tax=Streptomyces sp. NPDC096176 TaxID=3366079 RepID=UPI00381E66B4
MRTLVLDLVVAAVTTVLEGAALFCYWLGEGLKQRARNGSRLPGAERRFVLVLALGATLTAVAAVGLFRAGLVVTGSVQIMLSVALALLLGLGAVTELRRALARRARLRR